MSYPWIAIIATAESRAALSCGSRLETAWQKSRSIVVAPAAYDGAAHETLGSNRNVRRAQPSRGGRQRHWREFRPCNERQRRRTVSSATHRRAMTITITAFERSPDGGKGLARDTRVRWALEEVGQPYQVRLVSFQALKQPAHLALHPFGQIPTFEER